MIPLNDLPPKKTLDSLTKYFKDETRPFYIGSTHDTNQRQKQHGGVFDSNEMVVIYKSENRDRCISVECTLINALEINGKFAVNKEKRSKLPSKNAKSYSVYILFHGTRVKKEQPQSESRWWYERDNKGNVYTVIKSGSTRRVYPIFLCNIDKITDSFKKKWSEFAATLPPVSAAIREINVMEQDKTKHQKIQDAKKHPRIHMC